MKKRALPSQAELQRLFEYNSETGILIWRHRTEATPQWNGNHAGKPAGTRHRSGYRVVHVRREFLYVHCVIWKFVHGAEHQVVDHIDGNPSNNKLANLRPATRSQNSINRTRLFRLLPRGVSWHRASGKYAAEIKGGKRERFYLGVFCTAEEAAAAYRQKARELHGEFTRLD